MLSTGKRPLTIEFDTGDVETVYINPTDTDIARRMKEIPKALNEWVGDLELDASGQSADEPEKVEMLLDKMYAMIDKAFDADVSSKLFKHCNAFATVDGRLFFEVAIEYLLQLIAKESPGITADMMKHLEKYN